MPSITRDSRAHRARRNAAEGRMLEATAELLRCGERFTEMPVERILTEADVSRSTFYGHFADKTVLLRRLADGVLEQLTATADLWWRVDHAGGPAQVANVLRRMLEVTRAHGAVLGALGEVAAYDDELAKLWRSSVGRYAETAGRRLRDELGSDGQPHGVDLLRVMYVVILMVEAGLRDHAAHGRPEDDDAVIAALARAAWLAVYGTVPTTDTESF